MDTSIKAVFSVLLFHRRDRLFINRFFYVAFEVLDPDIPS